MIISIILQTLLGDLGVILREEIKYYMSSLLGVKQFHPLTPSSD